MIVRLVLDASARASFVSFACCSQNCSTMSIYFVLFQGPYHLLTCSVALTIAVLSLYLDPPCLLQFMLVWLQHQMEAIFGT